MGNFRGLLVRSAVSQYQWDQRKKHLCTSVMHALRSCYKRSEEGRRLNASFMTERLYIYDKKRFYNNSTR